MREGQARADEAAAQRAFVDSLISAVSHQFRTPLAVIVGYAELIGARDDEAVRKEAALRIQEAAERLSATIDDILMAAALDSRSVDLDPAPVDLGDAVEDTLAALDGRSFAVSAGPNGWPIAFADQIQLRRILGNLVSHACKRSPHGDVAIEARERNGMAIVSVSDDGEGLNDVERARVFQRFTQLVSEDGRSTTGTGLGLYVARALVELHGGSIWVESRAGEGATFRFTIPLAGTEAAT